MQRATIGSQLLRYGLVGIANTVVTATIIAALTVLGMAPIPANLAGFAAGLVNSYALNGRYTFGFTGSRITYFALSFALAYALNLGVLLAAAPLGDINILLPQAIALICYNIVFFVLMKVWVFSHGKD